MCVQISSYIVVVMNNYLLLDFHTIYDFYLRLYDNRALSVKYYNKTGTHIGKCTKFIVIGGLGVCVTLSYPYMYFTIIDYTRQEQVDRGVPIYISDHISIGLVHQNNTPYVDIHYTYQNTTNHRSEKKICLIPNKSFVDLSNLGWLLCTDGVNLGTKTFYHKSVWESRPILRLIADIISLPSNDSNYNYQRGGKQKPGALRLTPSSKKSLGSKASWSDAGKPKKSKKSLGWSEPKKSKN